MSNMNMWLIKSRNSRYELKSTGGKCYTQKDVQVEEIGLQQIFIATYCKG